VYLGSELAAGGNSLPWDKISAQNRVAIPIVDLAMQRLGLVTIDRNDRDDAGSIETH
jgi:hypothetical protein